MAVKSQLQLIARPMYSNPPVHGALIVSTVLGDPELKKLWLNEVKVKRFYFLRVLLWVCTKFSFVLPPAGSKASILELRKD